MFYRYTIHGSIPFFTIPGVDSYRFPIVTLNGKVINMLITRAPIPGLQNDEFIFGQFLSPADRDEIPAILPDFQQRIKAVFMPMHTKPARYSPPTAPPSHPLKNNFANSSPIVIPYTRSGSDSPPPFLSPSPGAPLDFASPNWQSPFAEAAALISPQPDKPHALQKKRWKCQTCPRDFPWISERTAHMYTVHAPGCKPLKCEVKIGGEVCGEMYANSAALTQHKLKRHQTVLNSNFP